MDNPKKVIFLDIDGVLQPFTQYRFEHIKEIPSLCQKLEAECHGKYPYSKWLGVPGLSLYDIAAVYFDWSHEAVILLKDVLTQTGARIVLSSSWRECRTHLAMEALFAIHGLDGYLDDVTMSKMHLTSSPIIRNQQEEDADYQKAKQWGDLINFLHDVLASEHPLKNKWGHYISVRTVEILEYLDRHPEIVSYVAVDDMYLEDGMEGHFVNTSYVLKDEHAQNMKKCLSDTTGPYHLPARCHIPELEEMRKCCVPISEARWRLSPDKVSPPKRSLK
jgi:hypothetical protein